MRGWWTVGWIGVVACADVVSGPVLPAPPPVVEAVLVAGATTVTARVGSTDRWTDPESGQPAPLHPVRLWLESAGQAARFDSTPDSAGYYRARLPIVAGARYELHGSVAGLELRGATTVPGPLVLFEPGGDTIPLPLGRIARFRIRWSAPGASSLVTTDGYFVAGPAGGAGPATRDSIADFVIAPPDRAADVSIEWWAENADLDGYLSAGAAGRSNLEGAFGVLGGASRVRRVLRWR